MITDLGFYSVRGKSFSTNKVMAVLEAQKTNAEVEWNYFDDVFNKADWLTEPEISLEELYRIRAQQIRDAYDYVVIYVSGGADSSNVVRTFINNNIHIDEVITEIPESGIKNFDWNDKDFTASNLMSEAKYAQYPILHEISINSPSTRITVHDFFTGVVNVESDEWIYQNEGDIISMSNYQYGRMDPFPHLKDLAEQGKKIASVWGTDKPVLAVWGDGYIYTLIADSAVYVPKYPFKTVYPNVNRVLFYWSPELPELMIKQSHIVAREILKPENKFILRAAIDQGKRSKEVSLLGVDDTLKNIFNSAADTNVSYSPKTIYQRSIVPFIYPNTFREDVFQVLKFEQSQTFCPAINNWMKSLHGNSRIGEMIISDFSLFYKNILPKYLNPNKTGFNMCLKRFRIGSIKSFLPKSNNNL